ncbi:GumC family protein [Devosia limi]|nr:hypothetical protein [Devosia limi]
MVIGAYVVFSMPRSYVSQARIVAQSPQISSALVESTVTGERLQFFEQRAFSRDNLVGLARKFNLYPGVANTGSDSQLATLVRNHITLRYMPADPNDPSSDAAIFTLGFEGDTPQLAADVTNEIIAMIIRENREARMGQAREASRFLEQEVAALQAQSDQVEARWNAFITTNEALLPSRLPLYTSEMQELNQELLTLQTASATLMSDTRLLETQLSIASSAQTSAAAAPIDALRAELSDRLTIFSDSHPQILALRARIAAMEASLARGEQQPGEAPRAEVALLTERIATANQQRQDFIARRAVVNERVAALRATIAQMPSVEAELSALQRERDAMQASLAGMQAKLDTALVGQRLESDQQDAQVRVLDAPEVPRYASGSGRTRNMMIVLGLAAIVGLACLVLADLLDRTIKGRRDFTGVLEGATLVVLPNWSAGSTSLGVPIAVVGVVIAALAAMLYVTPLGATLSETIGLVIRPS